MRSAPLPPGRIALDGVGVPLDAQTAREHEGVVGVGREIVLHGPSDLFEHRPPGQAHALVLPADVGVEVLAGIDGAGDLHALGVVQNAPEELHGDVEGALLLPVRPQGAQHETLAARLWDESAALCGTRS